ncbi:hypothetical protein H4219_001277 [Mycoemilia scoparia]|uniref:AB hydrolase-1 domain-containing protein n=1 Tax=Mycoemilia scoparia TaxID=417184 RepID=A0A9W8A8H9_9FUNG|nr:hypothetical protein H4219_001277 [Mycoemilia scoparia]
MTKATETARFLGIILAIWSLGQIGLLPLPDFLSEVWSTLPFVGLVGLGAYAFCNIGYNLLTFRECPEAYHELMQQIREAKEELRSKDVDMEIPAFVSQKPASGFFSSLLQPWGLIRSVYLQTSYEKAEKAERKILSRLQFFSKDSETDKDSEIVARVGDVHLGEDRYIHTLYIERIKRTSDSGSSISIRQSESSESASNPIIPDTEEGVASLSPKQNASRLGYHKSPQSRLDLSAVPRIDRSITNEASGETDDSKMHNLVIAHGFGCGVGNFYRNYNSLSKADGWRIFSIDWLGMGRSSRPHFYPLDEKDQEKRIEKTEDFFVDSLEEWRKKMGLKKMTLLGHSLGAYFCAVYSLRYPERVEKLILVSPAGIPEPDKEKMERIRQGNINIPNPPGKDGEAHTEQKKGTDSAEKTAPLSRRLFINTFVYLWDRNCSPQSIVRTFGPLGSKIVGKYVSRFSWLNSEDQADLAEYMYHITVMKGSGEYALNSLFMPGVFPYKPLIDRVKGLKMPTIFMYGTHDWMDYKGGQEACKKMSVPTKLFQVPNAGHNIHLENPKEFDSIIINELNEVKSWTK